jgi:hypothetical protein
MAAAAMMARCSSPIEIKADATWADMFGIDGEPSAFVGKIKG